MLIGGDDMSNDVITLGMCFSMFVYIRAYFRFALIGGPSFSLPATSVPRKVCSQASPFGTFATKTAAYGHSKCSIVIIFLQNKHRGNKQSTKKLMTSLSINTDISQKEISLTGKRREQS